MRLGIKAHSQGGDNKPRWAANHNPDSIRSSQSEAVLIYVANQKPDTVSFFPVNQKQSQFQIYSANEKKASNFMQPSRRSVLRFTWPTRRQCQNFQPNRKQKTKPNILTASQKDIFWNWVGRFSVLKFKHVKNIICNICLFCFVFCFLFC